MLFVVYLLCFCLEGMEEGTSAVRVRARVSGAPSARTGLLVCIIS